MEHTLGERIRLVRRKLLNARGRPMSLAEFGALVAEAERRAPGGGGPAEPYPHSTVSRWETDKRRPSDRTLSAIAEAAGTTLDELVHGGSGATARGSEAARGEEPRPTPGVGMTPRLTVWREAFRLELAKAGVSDEEIDVVASWLARPVWARAGGSPALAVSDDELLALWERMAAAARWCLAHRGRRFRTRLQPPAESLLPEDAVDAPAWALAREVEFRAVSLPAVLGAFLDARARATRSGAGRDSAGQ